MNFFDWFRERRDDYQAVLFDIDGTLATGPRPMPGAARMLEYLRAEGFPYYLLTNDGNHSKQEKCQLVARSGIRVEPDEIVSCSDALIEAARERGITGRRVFVLGDLGQPCYAEAAGLIPCRDADEIGDCAAVIAGEGRYDWYEHIQKAMNFLRRHPECPLIIPNPDSFWPGLPNGEFGIGAGGVGRFIAAILRDMGVPCEPVYLGKPYGGIFRHTIEVMKQRFGLSEVDPGRLIMVGDALFSDICGANRFGMATALVLTGVTTRPQLELSEGDFRPDFSFETLG